MKLPDYRMRELQGRFNALTDIAHNVTYAELEQFAKQLEPDSREYHKYIYLAGVLRKLKVQFDAHLEKPKVLAIRAIDGEDAPASAPENGRGKT